MIELISMIPVATLQDGIRSWNELVGFWDVSTVVGKVCRVDSPHIQSRVLGLSLSFFCSLRQEEVRWGEVSWMLFIQSVVVVCSDFLVVGIGKYQGPAWSVHIYRLRICGWFLVKGLSLSVLCLVQSCFCSSFLWQVFGTVLVLVSSLPLFLFWRWKCFAVRFFFPDISLFLQGWTSLLPNFPSYFP